MIKLKSAWTDRQFCNKSGNASNSHEVRWTICIRRFRSAHRHHCLIFVQQPKYLRAVHCQLLFSSWISIRISFFFLIFETPVRRYSVRLKRNSFVVSSTNCGSLYLENMITELTLVLILNFVFRLLIETHSKPLLQLFDGLYKVSDHNLLDSLEKQSLTHHLPMQRFIESFSFRHRIGKRSPCLFPQALNAVGQNHKKICFEFNYVIKEHLRKYAIISKR